MTDATVEQVVSEQIDRMREEAERDIREIVAQLEAGEKPYFQWTLTFDKAVALRDRMKQMNEGDVR